MYLIHKVTIFRILDNVTGHRTKLPDVVLTTLLDTELGNAVTNVTILGADDVTLLAWNSYHIYLWNMLNQLCLPLVMHHLIFDFIRILFIQHWRICITHR